MQTPSLNLASKFRSGIVAAGIAIAGMKANAKLVTEIPSSDRKITAPMMLQIMMADCPRCPRPILLFVILLFGFHLAK
jgi:hypothetical protein